MRLLLVVIFALVLGGSLGIVQTWREFSGFEERMELPGSVAADDGGTIADAMTASPPPTNTTGSPRAEVVGPSSHDFGVMERDTSRSHSFVIRNRGDADLRVGKPEASCGICVETTFEEATLKPGEEVTIPVTLTARKPEPALNESLELRTSDTAHDVIRFDLIAYVSEAAGASVSELALGTVSTDTGGATSFRVYGFVDEPLEIVNFKLSDRDNQDYFEWEVSELTPEAVKAGQAHAHFAKEIKIAIKPGMPVGPLEQNITIIARAGKLVTINVPVTGRVTGDLSLLGGSKFSTEMSLLSLGRILVGEGAAAKLHMMVKGEHRDEVQLTIGTCDPADYLSATVGERKAIQDGKTYLFPITVELDKRAPAMNRLGGVGSAVGRIVIHTTHPTAKEVILFVRFAVE
ncbi:MAG: DUF1573 domain-containing protein [Planctomycetota bacterium]|nr:DUF1573 domain-containing protein [Planctomycetota bacterium]